MRRRLPEIALVLAAASVLVSVALYSSIVGEGNKRRVPSGDLNTVRPLKGGAPQTEIRNAPNEGRLAEPHAVGGAQTYSWSEVESERDQADRVRRPLHRRQRHGGVDRRYFRRPRRGGDLRPRAERGTAFRRSRSRRSRGRSSPRTRTRSRRDRHDRLQRLARPVARDADLPRGVLADLMRDAMRHGIPLRRVDPVGCNFIPGWTDHNALECGNNHTDVLPNFPWDVLAAASRPEATDEARAGAVPGVRALPARGAGQ
jgi:hypothetical protein